MRNMITQTKEQYVSPRSEELEMNLEGVIAMCDFYHGAGFEQ